MKKLCIVLCLLALQTSLGVFAKSPRQAVPSPLEKGLGSINRESAQAFVEFLASDELQGREAGTEGGRIAGNYLASLLKLWKVQPLYKDYFQPFEAYRVERQRKGRLQVHPDSIRQIKEQGVYQKYAMRNILCQIEGKKKEEYVVIGAHYDHLGIDPTLAGDRIYNGADDNASGISAVLQILRGFLTSGTQPERTIIFAFWDGEEKGLLGSKYFAQTFPDMKKIKGYLNFDMIGRNNDENRPLHVVYFYTAGQPVFGEWLKKDIQEYRLQLEPDYRAWDRPTGGSDNATFALHDIPIMWYHTDGHRDYHLPGDESDKLNWNKLVEITRAAFLGMWKMANENW